MSALPVNARTVYVLPLGDVSLRDIGIVGGKNASLGKLIQHLERTISISSE